MGYNGDVMGNTIANNNMISESGSEKPHFLWSLKRENGDEPSKLGISYIQTNPCVLLAQGNVGDGEKK